MEEETVMGEGEEYYCDDDPAAEACEIPDRDLDTGDQERDQGFRE